MTDLPRGYGSAAEEPPDNEIDVDPLRDRIAQDVLEYYRLEDESSRVWEAINEECFRFKEETGCEYDWYMEEDADWWRHHYPNTPPRKAVVRDLVKACEGALDLLDTYCPGSEYSIKEQILAAIAKAKGENHE